MASLHLIPDSSFVLFLAPPAWGKTSMIEELWKEGERGIVFVSPLRALAVEVRQRFKKEKEVFYFENPNSWREIRKKYLNSKKAFLIVTPETIPNDFYDELENMEKKPLVVIDEFHLFYSWGETFRPLLFDSVMAFSLTKSPLIGLSATMSENLILKWKCDFALTLDHLFLLNLGNQKLLYPPSKKFLYFSFFPKMFRRRFIFELLNNNEGTFLYFCSKRYEVDHWLDFCERRGILALGCKGGEVQNFMEALKMNPNPKVIFATSALSHGVNLPAISKIFISEALEKKDFWLQMVGRGGRKGEEYELYSFDDFDQPFKLRLRSFLKEVLYDIFVRWKLVFELE